MKKEKKLRNRKHITYEEMQLYRNNGDKIEGKCHICTSHSIGSHGYVQVFKDGKMKLWHRLVLEEKLKRPIKEGMFACHTCDIKRCGNPNHIEEHTQDWNNKDKMLKGRTPDNIGRKKNPKLRQNIYELTSPNKEIHITYNLTKFSQENNIKLHMLNLILMGKREETEGWYVRKIRTANKWLIPKEERPF